MTGIPDAFVERTCDWLRLGGPEGDIVISTRARLARNVRGYPMPWRMNEQQRNEVAELIAENVKAPNGTEPLIDQRLDHLDPLRRQVLLERNLISREMADGDGRRALHVSANEQLAIMAIEEDHLRLQTLRPGLQLDTVWHALSAVDTRLERSIPYAVSAEHGYLTACPTNVGTGLRISVMLHLPLIVQSDQIARVTNAAHRVGLVLRGLRGEGSEGTGDFFQVSNQVTLGRTEDDIVAEVQRMVEKIVEWERGLRGHAIRHKRNELEDHVWRAWGCLRFARRIGSQETLKQLSALRLGVNLDLIREVDLEAVNQLFLFSQPAHLQMLLGETVDGEVRDQKRASFIRQRLTA